MKESAIAVAQRFLGVRFGQRVALGAAAIALGGLAVSTAGAAGTSSPQLSQSSVSWGSVGQLSDGLWYIARYEGFFKKYGLTDNPVLVSGGPQAAAGVVSGSLQFSQSGVNVVATDDINGADLGVQFLLCDGHTPNLNMALSGSAAKAAGVTNSSPLADQMKAMQGLTVGLPSPGGSGETAFNLTLQAYGIPENSVHRTYISSAAGMQAAFASGQIGAFLYNSPTAELTAANDGGVFVNIALAPPFKGIDWQGYETSKKFLQAHPDTVAAWAKAMVLSWHWWLTHQKATEKILESFFPTSNDTPADAAAFNESFQTETKDLAKGLVFSTSGYKVLLATVQAQVPNVFVPMSTVIDNGPIIAAGKALGIDVLHPFKIQTTTKPKAKK